MPSKCQPNYIVELAGQQAQVRDGVFHWNMPALPAGEFVPLILRDLRGRELAPGVGSGTAAAAHAGTGAFSAFLRWSQAGSPAPVLGPFDGDLPGTRVGRSRASQSRCWRSLPAKS